MRLFCCGNALYRAKLQSFYFEILWTWVWECVDWLTNLWNSQHAMCIIHTWTVTKQIQLNLTQSIDYKIVAKKRIRLIAGRFYSSRKKAATSITTGQANSRFQTIIFRMATALVSLKEEQITSCCFLFPMFCHCAMLFFVWLSLFSQKQIGLVMAGWNTTGCSYCVNVILRVSVPVGLISVT